MRGNMQNNGHFKPQGRIYGEVAVISVLFLAFFVSGALSGIQYRINLWAMYIGVFLSAGVFFGAFFLYWKKREVRSESLLRSLPSRMMENKELLFLLGAAALLRLGLLDLAQRWDGEAYLKSLIRGCRNYDFTLLSYFDSFRLCSHTSLGYALFAAIGEYLAPGDVYGINLVNLVLYLFYTLFLYRIMEHLLPESSKRRVAAAVFVITSGPMALGTFGILNIDMAVMLFSVYVLYLHMSGRYILLCFFSIVLTQSKETGSVVLAGYMLFWLLYRLWTKGWACLKDRALWAMLPAWGGLLIYLFLLRFRGMTLWYGGIRVGEGDGETMHYFALSLSYIWLKIKMIFAMNFYWLFTLISVSLLGILGWRKWRAFRKNRIRDVEKPRIKGVYHGPEKSACSQEVVNVPQLAEAGRHTEVWQEVAGPLIGFCGGMAALFLFSCLYVTWSNPRYHYPLEMFLLSVTVLLVLKVVRRGWMKSALLVLLAVCCLAQSYTTVDWVTKKLFGVRPTGDGYVVAHPAWNAQDGEYQPEHVLADMAVYNNQMSYLDKAYDRILVQIGFDGSQDLIIWDDLPQYNGFSTSSIYRFWDRREQRRRFVQTDTTVPIRILAKPYFEQVELNDLAEWAVYIYTPGYGVEEELATAQLGEYYEVGERKEVSIWGQGSIAYYEMRKRPEAER